MIQGLGLDFESRSFASIKDDPHYESHPTTEAILLGWSFRGAAQVWDILQDKDNPPHRLLDALHDPNIDVLSFSSFDRRLYDHVHTLLGLPPVDAGRWIDVQLLALANGLPRKLDDVGLQLGLGHKQDDGKKLISLFCGPSKVTKKNPIAKYTTPEDAPEQWERFKTYAIRDVDLMMDIVDRIGYLSPGETAVAAVTQIMNSRGLPFDAHLTRMVDARYKSLQASVGKNLLELTGGILGNSPKFKGWFNTTYGQNLKSMTEAEDLMAKGALPEDATQALMARQVVAAKAGGKASTILASGVPDVDAPGIIRCKDAFLYCGASTTARFAGRGIQPQNFARPDHKTDVIYDYLHTTLPEAGDKAPESLHAALAEMELISSSMRALVRHPKGIAWVDFAGIEVRTLAIVADAFSSAVGGEDLGDSVSISSKLAKGVDLYIEMGVKIARALGVEGITHENCEKAGFRQIGKAAVLGLGYQQGAAKFMGTNKFDGRDMTFHEADIIVKAYRSAYPTVKALWRWLPSSLIRCLEQGRPVGLPGVFTYERMDDRTVRMVKPSGSMLWYRGIQISSERGKYGNIEKKVTLEEITRSKVTKKSDREDLTEEEGEEKTELKRKDIHGGMLLEHVCSSLARDLLVAGMVRAELAGIEIVSTVHDELVAVGGEDVADRLHAIMLDLPEWAKGWPIGASKAWGASWGK